MFDCFCLWPPLQATDADKNVPFETFPNQRVLPSVVAVGSSYVAKFLHQLYVYRVWYAPYLHRYALLINVMETVLTLYALLTQAGWDQRLEWRPLVHTPKYLRINFALVVSLLTVHSNLAAIAGLLMPNRAFLLWPYICFHSGTFVLELLYLVGKKRTTTLPTVARFRHFAPNVCRYETDKWWSPLMVFLLGFHLSIVIAVYLHANGRKLSVPFRAN